MKIIFLVVLLFAFNTAIASEGDFINTEVYKYSANNGTPVFTDKKPKKIVHQTLTIEAAKSTGSGGYETTLAEHSNTKNSRKSSKQKSKKKSKNASITTCRKYKQRFEAVSEKMRVGYKASQYRKLEKKRVKYRDLLFQKCNSYDLI